MEALVIAGCDQQCRTVSYILIDIAHVTLLWRHNGLDGVSNHQPHDCLLNRSFRHRSKKTSKLRVTGLCAGNSMVTGEFPAQMASDAENASIWWRHHDAMRSHCEPAYSTFNKHTVFIMFYLGLVTTILIRIHQDDFNCTGIISQVCRCQIKYG